MKQQQTQNKSDKFREMYDKGMSIAEISRATGDYYSFVHRVIKRHEATKEPKTPTEPTEPKAEVPKETKKPRKGDIKKHAEEGKSVDEIMEILELEESHRSVVYTTVKQTLNKRGA